MRVLGNGGSQHASRMVCARDAHACAGAGRDDAPHTALDAAAASARPPPAVAVASPSDVPGADAAQEGGGDASAAASQGLRSRVAALDAELARARADAAAAAAAAAAALGCDLNPTLVGGSCAGTAALGPEGDGACGGRLRELVTALAARLEVRVLPRSWGQEPYLHICGPSCCSISFRPMLAELFHAHMSLQTGCLLARRRPGRRESAR